MKKNNKDSLKKLYQFMLKENLLELDWCKNNSRIFIKRDYPKKPVYIKKEENKKEENSIEKQNLKEIISPIVGTFYSSPSPTSPPYVREGDEVDADQTVCIVEAMKIMNEIKAVAKCKIHKILVANGESVTLNQPLFLVKPL